MKLYLMTTSCSGKTHFARGHASYGGLPVVDFSKVNRAASEGVFPFAETAAGNSYRERVIAYLRVREEPVCLLGRRGPPDPPALHDVHYGVVLIPAEQHRRNWESRRRARPHTRWTSFADLEAKRCKLMQYAEAYDIAVFASFSEAIRASVDTE